MAPKPPTKYTSRTSSRQNAKSSKSTQFDALGCRSR